VDAPTSVIPPVTPQFSPAPEPGGADDEPTSDTTGDEPTAATGVDEPTAPSGFSRPPTTDDDEPTAPSAPAAPPPVTDDEAQRTQVIQPQQPYQGTTPGSDDPTQRWGR
jgi:hypothetical protein